ncbi:MAG: FMN-binding protein [SAR324 cluster bacterium]|nr:FMN-binding protein [SAR324 cluster bacterium]
MRPPIRMTGRVTTSRAAGLFAVTIVLAALPAHGQQGVYLTEREALAKAFSHGEAVRRVPLQPSLTVRTQIERAAGVPLLPTWVRCFQGTLKGHVVGYACIDNMIGKERPITYIIRIDHPAGRIAFVELMIYREAIGAEVRHPHFREQFEGKSVADPVRLREDIQKISGATLSSRALSDGARKILHLYQHYLRHLPPQ